MPNEKYELPTEDEIRRPNIDDIDDMEVFVRDYLETEYSHTVKSFTFEFDMRKVYITNIQWEEKYTLFQVQRQRTAGAYIGIKNCKNHEEAVQFLAEIAAASPDFPYNGEDKWQDSKNPHHVNRYRIIILD